MSFSDDFSTSSLSQYWSIEGPQPIATSLASDGSNYWLNLETSDGDFDIWDSNQAARVTQAMEDDDFTIGARFLTTPTERYQMQGLLIEQDAQNWIRFDTYSKGGDLWVFAAVTIDGVSNTVFNIPVAVTAASHLRISRSGDDWTAEYSADGEIWTTAGSFSHAMTVSDAGVFAGNTGAATGYVAQVDWFESSYDPLVTEDGVNMAPNAVDDALVVAEDTDLVITAGDLLSNDTDADGDTLDIVSVGAPEHGTIATNPDGSLTYSPDAGYRGLDSFSYTVSDGQETADAVVTLTVGTPPPPEFRSDDFHDGPLDPMWQVITPQGTQYDLGVVNSDSVLNLTTGPGNHDIWGSNNAARAMQEVADEDFALEARFLSTPTARYQMQGFVVEQDAQNWIRFDTYSDGSKLYAFAAITVNGASTVAFKVAVAEGTAPYLRLERSGDTYSFATSQDGETWTQAGTLTSALTVSSTGVFAGSSGASGGFTSVIDYVESSADRLFLEDGQGEPVAAVDDTFVLPADAAYEITSADLLLNDAGGDPATNAVVSVGAPSHGTLIETAPGTYTYTPDPGYNGYDSFTYIASDGTTSSEGTVALTVGTPPPPEFRSDDFHDGPLDPMWQVITPQGTQYDLGVVNSDSVLNLTTGPGNHDIWGSNNAARAMQEVADEDFALEARFLSTPTARYQMQGFVVEQDAQNWIRFDTYSDGTTLYAFAAITVNGQTSTAFRTAVAEGTAPYLRVERSGDTFAYSYSQDGEIWTPAGEVTHDIAVSLAGVFGGSVNAPSGFTAVVDWVQSDVNPVLTEDGIEGPPEAADDAFTTPADVALVLTVADLTANDSDPDGDPISVTLEGAPEYGTIVDNGDGTFTYTPDPGYNGFDSFGYSASDGTNSDSATVSLTVGTPPPPQFLSDDFHTDTLSQRWDVTLPDGTSTALEGDADDAYLVLSTAPGNYDIWGGTINAATAMQLVGNQDFSIEARFLDVPTEQHQMQGFLVQADDDNWMRFDLYSDGGSLYAFAATTVDGSPSVVIRERIDPSNSYIRLERVGDTYTFFHSADGETWEQAGSVTNAMVTTQLGLFAGSVGEDAALTARVDYVETDADPISAEDDGYEPPPTPPTVGADAFTMDPGTTLAFTEADLLANDDDINRDPLSVVSFTAPQNGTISDDGIGNYVYTPDAGFEGTETFQYVVSDGTYSVTGDISVLVDLFDARSDDFAGGTFDPAWRFEGIAGDVNLGYQGDEAFAMLESPTGIPVSASGPNLTTPRMVQDVLDLDFDISAGFLTVPSEKYQEHGLLVIQDDDNWLRFDVAFTGSTRTLIVGTIVDGKTTYPLFDSLGAEVVEELRILRTDDTFTFQYRGDGPDWTTAHTLDRPMTVAQVGVFAGSTSFDGEVPGYTAFVDYFQNSLEPIADEDGSYVPVNHAPVARNDFFGVSDDVTFDISQLLENDFDPDVGDTLTFVSLGEVATGTLTDNGDGTYTYVPDVGFEGIDELDYTITDGTLTATGTAFLDVRDPIDVWHGDVQQFGSPGESQSWINILGQVDPSVVELEYSLNGGPLQTLSIGPDTRRLQNPGDFNIDIDFDLLDGSAADDVVTITATLDNGAQYTRDVTVEYESGQSWSPNYAIDWSTVTDIQEAVQVVDGTWTWDENGARPVDLGYDRLLTLGDQDWDNYELNVKVTTHDLQNVDPLGRDGGAFAIGMLWNGHTDGRFADWQPATNYEPGASFFYTARLKSHSYHTFSEVLGVNGMLLEEDKTYNVTVRVEQGDLYDRIYSLKVWEEGAVEPVEWTLQTYEEFTIDEAPATGSIYLNAHYYDVTFGDLTVTEITGDDIIQGDETDEILIAVDESDPNPGRGENDVFVGNAGMDLFVLGTGNTVFYDDGDAQSSGTEDFAFLWDFVVGTDTIQLAGSASDYWLSEDETGLPEGTAIWYVGEDGAQNELVGLINNVYALDLEGDSFIYDDLLVS